MNNTTGISIFILNIVVAMMELRWKVALVACLVLLTFLTNTHADIKSQEQQDLYKILGVPRSADTKEIKRAYRRKALDTHPDKIKDKDISQEDAAEAFRRVVHAFEILSDDASRRLYDRTGRAGSAEQTHSQQQQQQRRGGGAGGWTFTWNSGRRYTYKKPKLKDRFDVKEAQSRLLHIVSLEQLETVIVDENGTLERNVIIAFCPAPLETHLMDEMVYP